MFCELLKQCLMRAHVLVMVLEFNTVEVKSDLDVCDVSRPSH